MGALIAIGGLLGGLVSLVIAVTLQSVGAVSLGFTQWAMIPFAMLAFVTVGALVAAPKKKTGAVNITDHHIYSSTRSEA